MTIILAVALGSVVVVVFLSGMRRVRKMLKLAKADRAAMDAAGIPRVTTVRIGGGATSRLTLSTNTMRDLALELNDTTLNREPVSVNQIREIAFRLNIPVEAKSFREASSAKSAVPETEKSVSVSPASL